MFRCCCGGLDAALHTQEWCVPSCELVCPKLPCVVFKPHYTAQISLSPIIADPLLLAQKRHYSASTANRILPL